MRILQEVRDEAGEVYTNGYCKPLKRPAEFRYSPEEKVLNTLSMRTQNPNNNRNAPETASQDKH